MAIEGDRINIEHAVLVNAIRKILDEPNCTMSDGKALREIMRVAKGAARQVKELQSKVK